MRGFGSTVALMLGLCGFGALFSAPAACATTYYVSAVGSDRADGLSPTMGPNSMPFATLAPLGNLLLRPGDRVLLACGQRFSGGVQLRAQGGAEAPVELAAYGDCAARGRPVVDGRRPVSLEKRATEDNPSAQVSQRVTQVFLGDELLPRARFPSDRYLVVGPAAPPSERRLPKDPRLEADRLAGAMLHARTQEWLVEERSLVDAMGNLDTPLRYPLRPKAGIYLTGKAWMIANDSGWAYDGAERRLTVAGTSGAAVAVTIDEPLLQVQGRGSVSVSGLDFVAAGGDAMRIHVDGAVLVRDVGVRWSAGNGLSVQGARIASVLDSKFVDSGRDGIFFAEVGHVVVQGNKVVNSGVHLGPGQSLAAINAHRTGSALIERNEVLRSAYIGIRFAGDALVRANVVEDSCLMLSDCAAIYTWRRNRLDRRPPVKVVGNAVVGVGGDVSVKFGVNDWFAGIYLDEWTRGAQVSHNLVANANQGIYLHNAFDNSVGKNLILGARVRATADLVDARVTAELTGTSPELPNRVDDQVIVGVDGSTWEVRRHGVAPKNPRARWVALYGLGERGATTHALNEGSQCVKAVLPVLNGAALTAAFTWLECR